MYRAFRTFLGKHFEVSDSYFIKNKKDTILRDAIVLKAAIYYISPHGTRGWLYNTVK